MLSFKLECHHLITLNFQNTAKYKKKDIVISQVVVFQGEQCRYSHKKITYLEEASLGLTEIHCLCLS